MQDFQILKFSFYLFFKKANLGVFFYYFFMQTFAREKCNFHVKYIDKYRFFAVSLPQQVARATASAEESATCIR